MTRTNDFLLLDHFGRNLSSYHKEVEESSSSISFLSTKRGGERYMPASRPVYRRKPGPKACRCHNPCRLLPKRQKAHLQTSLQQRQQTHHPLWQLSLLLRQPPARTVAFVEEQDQLSSRDYRPCLKLIIQATVSHTSLVHANMLAEPVSGTIRYQKLFKRCNLH